MQITIIGRHIDVTPAIGDHCRRKLNKALHHHNLIHSIQVTLSVEKMLHRAEAHLSGNKLELFADAESENLYTTIDALADKLERQLLKHKGKLRSHR
ncbi:MAG: ribosome-associated translation inhibitor RaiA [Gammaproteobacteria bacterium]|nr:ribosome-associated translation inhibitor RaiA [Gammaproteobacteria bacterium]